MLLVVAKKLVILIEYKRRKEEVKIISCWYWKYKLEHLLRKNEKAIAKKMKDKQKIKIVTLEKLLRR